ncbi:MAG: PepSY domain-containing protein [Alphaproteobacteria bacterium]|nr:PepSY domain-containing protein [Alphaproteobacteria bacterium]
MLRSALFQLHLWCGVILGAFLTFQAVTGAFVAFRHAGNHWLHRDEMIVAPKDAAQIPMSRVIELFREKFPHIPENVISVMYPQAPDQAFFLRIWDNAPSPNFYASMNPYTGEITGYGSKYQYPFELMFRLHEQLLMGTPGINLVHAGGFLMMVMSLSGLYLWWPRRESWAQALSIKAKPLKRYLYDLHRVVGAIAFVLLFVVATSGTMILGLLSLVPQPGASPGFGPLAGVTLNPRPEGPAAPVDNLISAARAQFPDNPIRDISYIRLMRAVVVVSFIADDHPNVRALNRVFFERHSGRILAVQAAAQQAAVPTIEQFALPVHSGEIAGNPGRFLVAVSGLVLPFLFVTGLWLWVTKRLSRHDQRAAEPG